MHYLILLFTFLFFTSINAQGSNAKVVRTDSIVDLKEARSLEDTKAYIEKSINNFGYWEDSDKRLKAEFEDDLLHLQILQPNGKPEWRSWLIDLSILHRTYPVKMSTTSDIETGLSQVAFWAGIKRKGNTEVRDKEKFIIGMKGKLAGDELLKAIRHLNKLLVAEQESEVEKF